MITTEETQGGELDIRSEIKDIIAKFGAGGISSVLADAIFSSSALSKIIEKANAFDLINKGGLADIARQLGLIMSAIMAMEKCYQCERGYPDCSLCRGTGYITRPATAEEVHEALQHPMRWHCSPNGRWQYRLKSGTILTTKEKTA